MDEGMVLDRIRAAVIRVIGTTRIPADVDAATPLAEEGLWLDSVELLQVVLACEAQFEITFKPAEDLVGDTLKTLGTLADVIRRRMSAPRASA
jgi:acyl carrier protein